MNIKYFCPLWGSDHIPFDTFCEKVKSEGFDGVEMGLPTDKSKKNEIINKLEKFDLELIGQHYETLEPDFEVHKKLFKHQLENLTKLSSMGVLVMPAAPGFYHQPTSPGDLVDFMVQRVCDHLGVEVDLSPRWGEE